MPIYKKQLDEQGQHTGNYLKVTQIDEFTIKTEIFTPDRLRERRRNISSELTSKRDQRTTCNEEINRQRANKDKFNAEIDTLKAEDLEIDNYLV